LFTGIIVIFDMNPKKPNRLIDEKSPYLQQHALNPVDWYPWGDEAFEKARREDKPIFLSIGYSTCYWCHVMEREVFENEELARLMNGYAVNIKVDREERPDVDRVYMKAVQATTGSGGWPMSVFLTHDLRPFYAATYIPPTAQYGRPGFGEVIESIHSIWKNDRERIHKTGTQIYDHLNRIAAPSLPHLQGSPELLEDGFNALRDSFDREFGGFGGAPKFPTPVTLNFLLRYHTRTGNRGALDMTLATLRAMASGGIYDHIGGGLHRYATDERWHVPHFEKMLYDQAQLVSAYLEAYQITGNEEYAAVARDILAYTKGKLGDPEGGFYSAEDAESATDPDEPGNKHEGAFYLWKAEELREILTSEEAEIAGFYYGVETNGNVRADPHGVFTGENILYRAHTSEATAERFGLSIEETKNRIDTIRGKLNPVRERRPRPHLDDKILLSWNGLMITAYARAYQVLGDETYLKAATDAAIFLRARLYDPESGRLFRRYRGGEARFEGQLEDYAFFIQGLLDLYEASFDREWFDYALLLTEVMIDLFYDDADGGFFDTTGADASIIVRSKEWHDGAEPSGNAIAIYNLLRIEAMTQNAGYGEKARQSLSHFGQVMQKAPQATTQFLSALDFSLSKPKQIVIAGSRTGKDTGDLIRVIHAHFIPNKVLILTDGSEGDETGTAFAPFFHGLGQIDGKATAYVCENYTCELPVTDPVKLSALLTK
jgi:uncharacterized protein